MSKNTPPALSITPRRLSAVSRVVWYITLFSGITALGLGLLYQQNQAWQFWLASGGLVAMIACAWLGKVLVSANRPRLGKALVVFSLFTGMLFIELSLAGVTPFVLVIGALLTWQVVGLMFPRAWIPRIGFTLGYIALEALANRLPLLERYDTAQTPILQVLFATTLGVSLLVVLLYSLQSVRFGSIRYRLIAAFIAITLLPLAVTGVFSSLINARDTETRVVNQLESVVTLKEAEISSWLHTLDITLSNLVSDEDQSQLNTVMLSPDAAPGPVYSQVHDRLQGQITRVMGRVGMFEEIFMMNSNGRVILSTDLSQEGKSFRGQSIFDEGMRGKYVSPPLFAPTLNAYRVVVVTPLTNASGQVVGVLAGRASMNQLNGIMLERAGLGETGETYLVGTNNVLITSLRGGEQYRIIRSEASNEAISRQRNGSLVNYSNTFGQPVIGVYHWVDALGVALIAEQERAEALVSIRTNLSVTLLVILGSLLAAVILALLVTQSIADPIAQLAQTTSRMAAGNLNLQMEVKRGDEIGSLATAFNSMATQLRAVFAGLEERVAERTRELERRSTQLQVASEVARDITAAKSLNDLLNEAVNLIRDRFAFYHAGIFLVDEQGEYAVLRAATGEAGRAMLEREHRLKVGAVGLVGYVTGTGRPRIAQDVGEDAIHFKNPLLPHTRSELALPLRVGTRITGALDVQSMDSEAFSQEDVTVLQTLADQLAVAIENARLLSRMNQSVRELEQAYGEYTRQSWYTYTRSGRQIRGYRYRRLDVEATKDQRPEAQQALHSGEVIEVQIVSQHQPGENEAAQAEKLSAAPTSHSALAVPIRLREQVIGVLNLRFESHSVPHESRLLAEEIANRLALVLENSRLLQEAQRLALREQQINLIATEVRGSVNLETILQTTVRELGKALGADRTYIQIGDTGRLSGADRAPGGSGNGHTAGNGDQPESKGNGESHGN